jgi:hypothetical protein
MALQVRRGTNAERLGITPLAGELVYTTDTKQLYVGDGATAGGITSIAGTIDSVLADTTPQLGGDLDLNSHNITGTGNINITGTITATGNINLGDGVGSDIVVFGGAIQGHLVPDADITWNLGSPTKQFNEVWISQLNVENQLNANRINASLIADDSTVVFDATTGLIASAQLTGTLPAGVIPADITANITGNLLGNVTGNLEGNTVGYHTGDVTGSLFGGDSTLIIDGINNSINTDVINNVGQQLNINAIAIRLIDLDPANTGKFSIDSYQQQAGIDLFRFDDGADLSVTPNQKNSLLRFGYSDQNGESITALLQARNDFLQISTSNAADASDFPLANNIILTRTGLVGIGVVPTTDTLEVAGTGKFNGYVQFGSYTDTDRNALTPAYGMVIYNTTSNVFQGYQHSGGITPEWVNLS